MQILRAENPQHLAAEVVALKLLTGLAMSEVAFDGDVGFFGRQVVKLYRDERPDVLAHYSRMSWSDAVQDTKLEWLAHLLGWRRDPPPPGAAPEEGVPAELNAAVGLTMVAALMRLAALSLVRPDWLAQHHDDLTPRGEERP